MKESFTLYIASDHAGFEMKEDLKKFLRDRGYEVKDVGNAVFQFDDDYPDFGIHIGRSVCADPGSRGIVLCGSGIGTCIAANKVFGARASCARNEAHAQSGRYDDDTNILCIGSRNVSLEEAQSLSIAWLEAEFRQEERFLRRVKKLLRYEKSEAIRLVKTFSHAKVIPSILEKNVVEAYKKMSLLEGVTDWIQLDIMDGKFVPEKSFSLEDFDTDQYPFLYEAHLMVSDPFQYLDECARKGIGRVFFHWEAVRDESRAKEICENIAKKGMSPGIALNFSSHFSVLKDILPFIDSILFLSVAPGRSGQAIIPGIAEKVFDARDHCPARIAFGVDGGINEKNIGKLASVGVERAAVSGAIFDREDPEKSFLEIQRLFLEQKKR